MNAQDIIIEIYPYVITLLYAAVFIVALFQYVFRAFMLRTNSIKLNDYLSGPITSDNKERMRAWKVVLCVLSAFFVSRILILVIGYAGLEIKNQGNSLIRVWKFVYTQWDASHYIGIAENGYQTQGDARLHIVFYPLYPILIRFLNFVTRDSILSSFILSNAFLIASGVFIYMLSYEVYGMDKACACVWLFMFSMGAVFYSIPYTESLFVLLTTACVYFARKRRFWLAVLLGALCSLSRLPGAITAVCVFFEMIRSRLGYIRRAPCGKERYMRMIRTALVSFTKCLLILGGFIAYLIVNKTVTGSFFTFLDYQKNHWGQEAGSIFRTAGYSIRYLFYPFIEWYRMGVYFPQCIAMLYAVLVLFLARKDAHPSDIAYSVVYLFVTLSPTMLISGPRYISAMYPLYPMTAVIMKKNKASKYLILIFWIAFFVYSSYMFMVEWTYL